MPQLGDMELHQIIRDGKSLWQTLVEDRRKMRELGQRQATGYWADLCKKFGLPDPADALRMPKESMNNDAPLYAVPKPKKWEPELLI